MRTIGVRELKAHLSRVLRDVQAGEHVLVTDRGRVVAEIRRPDLDVASVTPVDRALSRLAARGVLRLAERAHEPYPRSPLKQKAGTASSLLDLEREER
jgi:antitoxin (DNA-binding transcriptional repressor) of toxin-antitoxin stability system